VRLVHALFVDVAVHVNVILQISTLPVTVVVTPFFVTESVQV
jgi:hypothetical protein